MQTSDVSKSLFQRLLSAVHKLLFNIFSLTSFAFKIFNPCVVYFD